jgi:putative ABC transport system ATP-binding protein
MTLLLHDVVKHYPGAVEVVRAADGITLSVAAGEMVALYGPSGSGKTTLLMLAAGLLAPDSGAVSVDGRDVAAMSGREAARFRRQVIGVIFQSPHLMAGVPALENAALKLLAEPISLTAARRMARPWMRRLGLERQQRQISSQLSGGERQRVALARALVNEPRLLLADEPTGNLDTQRSREVLELLREVAHERGIAILLATHDPQAAEVADRALTLRDGKLIDGEPPSTGTPPAVMPTAEG